MVYKKTTWLILTLIVIAGAVARLVSLSTLPPGLNWDEVSHGFNSYSLLKTGRDQWSQAFPVFNFRAFGDYPTTLNLYMTVLPISLFGPTDFSLRFPHALIGTLTILLAYIAGFRWQKNRLVGLLAAGLVAFEPWTFFPSRAVFQSNWAVFLLFLGLAYFFSRKPFTAVIVWGLSLFAYHNTRIFVPILLLSFFFHKRIRTQKIVLSATLVVLVLSLGVLWLSQSRARGSWVGILDSGAIAYLEHQRNVSPLPHILARLVFNRPVFMAANVVKNYFGYFSPRFLSTTGGTQYQFSLPGFGVLTPILLPFFYAGIYLLYRRRQWFLLAWLVLSPLPAAITRDQYAVIRATTMIPAVMLCVGVSLAAAITYFKNYLKVLFSLVLVVVYVYFLAVYSYSYFYDYPAKYSASWQYGSKDLVAKTKVYYSQFDEILVTKRYGEPHEFFLWYWPWNPAEYQTDPALTWDFHDNWYWVNGFARLRFVNDWEIQGLVKNLPSTKKYLIISSPDSQPAGAKIDSINFLDGSAAYVFTAL